MNPIFAILLWILVIYALYVFSIQRVGNAEWFWKRNFDNRFNAREASFNVFESLGGILQKPGWVVKSTTNETSLKARLKKANNPLLVKQVLGYKQLVWVIFLWSSIIGLWFGVFDFSSFSVFLGVVLFFYFFVDLWIKDMEGIFRKKIQDDIPSFLDLVSLVLDTGKGAEQSLEFVCKKQDNLLSHTISKELKLMDVGKSFEEVLFSLKKTIQSENFDGFVMSVLQSKKLGVSLSETLKLQSELINTQKRQRGEEMSRTASVKISLPLVLFIFPALLMLFLGPGILQLMGGN